MIVQAHLLEALAEVVGEIMQQQGQQEFQGKAMLAALASKVAVLVQVVEVEARELLEQPLVLQ